MANNKIIKTTLIGLLTAVLFASCGAPKVIYLPGKTEYVYRDSLITKIDTLKVPVPVESHTNVAADSSHLETSLAVSDASVDTLGFLHHSLRNKKTSLPAAVPVTEHIVYRDSIVVKEVPVEVEVEKIVKVVPWPWKAMSVVGLIALFVLALKLVFKFKV